MRRLGSKAWLGCGLALLLGCAAHHGSGGGERLPGTVDEAVAALATTLEPARLEAIRGASWEELIDQVEPGPDTLGARIEASWLRRGATCAQADPLYRYFLERGVDSPSGMSLIILATLRERLNDRPGDSDALIEEEMWSEDHGGALAVECCPVCGAWLADGGGCYEGRAPDGSRTAYGWRWCENQHFLLYETGKGLYHPDEKTRNELLAQLRDTNTIPPPPDWRPPPPRREREVDFPDNAILPIPAALYEDPERVQYLAALRALFEEPCFGAATAVIYGGLPEGCVSIREQNDRFTVVRVRAIGHMKTFLAWHDRWQPGDPVEMKTTRAEIELDAGLAQSILQSWAAAVARAPYRAVDPSNVLLLDGVTYDLVAGGRAARTQTSSVGLARDLTELIDALGFYAGADASKRETARQELVTAERKLREALAREIRPPR